MRFKFLSDEAALSLSHGEIKNSNLLNYKTGRPARDGLLAQNIFGPVRDFTCDCAAGRKRYNYAKRGSVCHECGTEINYAVVRSHYMGHITLPFRVINPFAMDLLKGLTVRVGNSSTFPAIGVGVKFVETPNGMICNTEGVVGNIVFHEVDTSDNDNVASCMTETLYTLLDSIDVAATIALRPNTKMSQVLTRYAKYGSHPRDWLIKYLLVLPAGYREMVAMSEFNATNPINELYSRIMRKVVRINTLLDMESESPIDIRIYHAETLVLQKAIHGLFVGGMTDYRNNYLPGIIESFMGKGGRFRTNLLGKRVDYSGRSAITADPSCRLTEIGIPEGMCWELLKPFIISDLRSSEGYSLREATRRWTVRTSDARDSLYKIAPMHKVLVNRAPTLHKYNVQAYTPRIVSGKAILMPPMCCGPFNADFDGDTVAIHTVMTSEARAEANLLMTSESNLFSSATGSANLLPSHEMIIGLYVMTRIVPATRPIYSKSISDLTSMLDRGEIRIGTEVNYKYEHKPWVKTCLGRVLLSNLFKTEIDYVLDKKSIRKLVDGCKNRLTNAEILDVLYEVSKHSFKYATQYGFSVGIDDIRASGSRDEMMQEAEKYEIDQLKKYDANEISREVLRERVTRHWFKSIGHMQRTYLHDAGPDNPIVMMYNSGARVSMQQISQITVAKGMFTDIHGNVDMTPIKGSLTSGLSGYDFFKSCSGSRKSLADKKSMTPKCGYLTRKLITLLRELYITESDCGTFNGIYVPIADVNSRSILEKRVINGVEMAKVRSPVTCNAKSGICAKCYGNDLASSRGVRKNAPIGAIAAQSLTEPATQMSMRTFHTSGAASLSESALAVKSHESGKITITDKDFCYSIKVGDHEYYGLKSYIQLNCADNDYIKRDHVIFTYNDPHLNSADIGGVFPRLEKAYELGSVDLVDKCLISPYEGTLYIKPNNGKLDLFVGAQFIGSSISKPVFLHAGAHIEKGTQLTPGIPDVREIFSNHGLELAAMVFIRYIQSLYAESGLTAKSNHIEMVFRGLTEIVMKDGAYSLRSRCNGDYDGIVISGVNTVCTRFPTPLKKMSYGYTMKAVSSSINSADDIELLPSEKIMMGGLIPSVLEEMYDDK